MEKLFLIITIVFGSVWLVIRLGLAISERSEKKGKEKEYKNWSFPMNELKSAYRENKGHDAMHCILYILKKHGVPEKYHKKYLNNQVLYDQFYRVKVEVDREEQQKKEQQEKREREREKQQRRQEEMRRIAQEERAEREKQQEIRRQAKQAEEEKAREREAARRAKKKQQEEKYGPKHAKKSQPNEGKTQAKQAAQVPQNVNQQTVTPVVDQQMETKPRTANAATRTVNERAKSNLQPKQPTKTEQPIQKVNRQEEKTMAKVTTVFEGIKTKEDADRCIEILKQRYSQQKKPLGLRQLIDENPDLPIRKLNTYLKEQGEEKPERFYIRNYIMRGLETDMKEFVLCNVMLQEVPCWSIAVRDVADIQPGENVKVEGGGLFVGPLIETRKCLGIDAPQPIDQIRYHCYGRTQLPVTRSAAAVKRWPFADPVDDTIPDDFVPAPEGKFRTAEIVNLEEINQFGNRNYDIAQIRFRGLLPELQKLQKHLEATGKKEYEVCAVEDDIAELVISCYEVKEEFSALIRKYPALKVTGLMEYWTDFTVLAFYSESGYASVTKIAEKGYFDPEDDGGDGRWAYDIDMMGRKTVSFDHTQTSEEVRFVYSYPFKKLWETNSYVREKDGVIYVKTVKK